ncbi:MAG: hypothetical protein KF812_12480 [Fimbriimonadaceae bacterium]|nr:hypothetical protein [Fimbriimonadaceae bacterium]
MTISEFVARTKRKILEDLRSNQPPSVGRFDANALEEAKRLGEVRIGTHQIQPYSVTLEFLFGKESPSVVTIEVDTPERVVFLPIPDWVIENIWQGDIDGSAHFESHANKLVHGFLAKLTPEANPAEFAPRPPRRRE